MSQLVGIVGQVGIVALESLVSLVVIQGVVGIVALESLSIHLAMILDTSYDSVDSFDDMIAPCTSRETRPFSLFDDPDLRVI